MADKREELVRQAFPKGTLIKPHGLNTHLMNVTGYDGIHLIGAYIDCTGQRIERRIDPAKCDPVQVNA
jgi:hypothetical protein